jgi:hypothetical protein
MLCRRVGGTVACMEVKKNTYWALVGKLEPLGRPIGRCKGNIKMDFI